MRIKGPSNPLNLKDIQIDDFPKERKHVRNEAQRSDLQETNQQSLPIAHKERVLRYRAVLLQQLRRGAEQHGLRAHAGHPHQHFNEHAPAAVAQIGHDVVRDVPVVRGVAAGGERDGGGHSEDHVHRAHAENALHGHAECLGLLGASHLLLAVREEERRHEVGEEAEVVAERVGSHAEIREELLDAAAPEKLRIEVNGVGGEPEAGSERNKKRRHDDHDVSENEREDAEPRHEEELLRVPDAAQHVAAQGAYNVENQVTDRFVAEERLRPGKILDEFEHADHRAQHHAPNGHVEEDQEDVVAVHTVKLVVTKRTNTNLVHQVRVVIIDFQTTTNVQISLF